MHQEQRKQSNDSVEHRYATGKVELRKSESGAAKLFGYALRFDSVYDMWEHTEEVAKGAFANTDMSDIRVLFNHDNNQILGRTKAGTARTGIDANGLWYEVDLPNSPAGENVRVAVERGDIDQSSWGFILRTNGDKWERRDGKLHRVLTDVEEIFDVSPVTFPANPDTTVAKRSLQGSGIKQEKREGAEMDDAWEISYVIDNSVWALSRANDMIYALNAWVERYDQIASANNSVSAIYKGIADDSRAAKQALVSLIDGHANAIKALNGMSARGSEKEKETREKQDSSQPEANTDTDTEIEFAKLERRIFNFKLTL